MRAPFFEFARRLWVVYASVIAFFKNARKFKWEDTKKQLSFVLYTGIGRSTAKMLVKCGAEVIALSRTQEDLDSLKKEVG